MSWLLVFVGGGLGAASRHGVNIAAARFLGVGFPWGTIIVNVGGSLAMGLIVAWLAFRGGGGWTQHTRLFLTTGFLGGFTTFSAFSLDVALLGAWRARARDGLRCRLGGTVGRRSVPRHVAGARGVVTPAQNPDSLSHRYRTSGVFSSLFAPSVKRLGRNPCRS